MFVCGQCGQRYDRGGYCLADGRPLFSTDDPLLGTQLGRYRIAALLGEGGMGSVYLAVQPMIGSRVAIKILSDQCSRKQELLDRFFAEAKAVNLIRHESIVSVLDMAMLDDGRPYIVMEYIEGQTLGPLVQDGAAPLGGVVQVMGEVLSALSAAHAIGIVHRDLKPDNILITNEGHAKVLDFGIAKLAPGLSHLSPRTRTGALLGTPAYMAPEQISGNGVIDPRTDVYASGIVLYEAVTGRVPFAGETLFDLMRQHLEDPPPPASLLRRDLPPAIETVIATALEKNPARRFDSAIAMADALVDAAAQLPFEHWRALVRGSAITGGRSSITKIRPTPTPRTRNPRPSNEAPTTAIRAARRPDRPPPDHLQPPTYVPDRPVITDPNRPTIVAEPTNRGSRRGLVIALSIAIAGVVVVAIAIANQDDEANAAGPAADSNSGSVAGSGSADPDPLLVVGGGSAASHGVHKGSNVHTGANVIVGATGRPMLTMHPAYDWKRFDLVAYLPKARELARQIYPDADFTEFQLYNNVSPDGLARLAPTDNSYIEFRSRSRSGPTGGACYLMVSLGQSTVSVRIRSDETCNHPIRAFPNCTLDKVWAEAIRRGRKGQRATIGFLHDGKWFFDINPDGADGVETIDDCK